MYTLTAHSDAVIRDADGARIPAEPANIDWQAYQAWRTAGNVPAPARAPTETVPPVSDRQLFQGLAMEGAISEAEALSAVRTGEIPVSLRDVVDRLPEGPRFEAEMLISGATSFERRHPLVQALGAALGWTDERLDEFWRASAQL